MSEVFESIERGMLEALAFAKGNDVGAIVHQFEAIDIKKIRKDVGMTQVDFAQAFGISVGTLRHWERGDRKSTGPALVLLNVVAKEPEAVLRALSLAA